VRAGSGTGNRGGANPGGRIQRPRAWPVGRPKRCSWELPRAPACSLRTLRARGHARIAQVVTAALIAGRAAVAVEVAASERALATARGIALPDAACVPVEAAVRDPARVGPARMPLVGTGATLTDAVLAGIAAEADVPARSAVVRVREDVDTDAVADGVLAGFLEDAVVVHTLLARTARRAALPAQAVLAGRTRVAAGVAVVPVRVRVDAVPVAREVGGILAHALGI